MRKGVSIYLDFLRAAAAGIVFLTHIRGFFFPSANWGAITSGRDAVAVFFVLSGFVISYVVSNKEKDWRSYATARTARIYPVVILAIFVALSVDGLGRSINPQFYTNMNEGTCGGFFHEFEFSALIRYITFTNQLWFEHSVIGSLEPFWSLGFEVQYYIFFGLISYLPKKQAAVAALVWGGLCGPNILLYLPLWLSGVFCQRYLASHRIKTKERAIALFILSTVFFVVTKHMLGKQTTSIFRAADVAQSFYNLFYFTLIGLYVSLNIIAVDGLFQSDKAFPKSAQKFIRWVAGRSFTFYLVHQPIALFFAALLSSWMQYRFIPVLGAILTLFASLLLGSFVEQRKHLYAPLARRLFFPASQ